MRRAISLILLFTLLLFLFQANVVYADIEIYDNEDYELTNLMRLMTEENLYNPNNPANSLYRPTIVYKTRTLYFNMELYYDKSVPVYGNYQDVIELEGKNDFSIPKRPLIGYYLNGSLKGEYRAHGYTHDKRLYLNNDFPRDSDSGRSVSEKKWIYRYWKDDEKEYASPVTTNATSEYYAEKEVLRKAIDNLVNDVLKNSTINSDDDRYMDHEKQGYAVADHMNVNQISSTRFNGEGKMMQENAGRLWYQMFSTEKATAKLKKEQEIQVKILDKGSYRFDSNGKKKIRVEVTGIYKDADIVTDSDKLIYYHRNEMKSIQLDLAIGSKSITFNSIPNTKVGGHSALTHVFELEIDEGDVTDGTILAQGETHTIFYSYPSDARNDSVYGQDMDFITGGLKSLFDVKDIELGEGVLQLSMIDYQDHSIGDIKNYHMTVVNQSTGREAAFTYDLSSDQFVNDLYDYLRVDDEYASYTVIQTVANDYSSDTYTDTFSFRKEVKKAVELKFEIPDDVIDVDKVEAYDTTDYGSSSISEKELRIDGKLVDWEVFFGGNYFFGPINSNYLAIIEIRVLANDVESIYKDAIHVHSSLPRTKLVAEGPLKQNRKVTLFNQSHQIEDSFVTAKYPNTYRISYSAIDGDMDAWKRKVIDENYIDMLFQLPGFYKATITATNGTGRTSSTDYHIGIVPDFEPNVIFNIWNNVLTRNEALEITYEASSLDGDTIASNQFSIYFDEDEDGTAEKLVYKTEDEKFTYTPDKLGTYLIVNDIVEAYGEDTLSEFISEDDIVKKRVERIFYVDNLRPLVEIDLDIPENFQQVDMYILSDENYELDSINELRENRVAYNNALRLYGLDAEVKYRDLKTYVSTQAIDTSIYFGSTYPSSTYHFSSNGFTGVLNRYSLTDNSYQDYYTTTESYEHCETVNVFNGYVNCDSGCLSSCNFSNWHNCDGSCCDKDYIQRRSCETRYDSVRHYYTVHRYTGYYKGTASKSIKQPYSNPFRELSDKYVVYLVDENGFNLADFNELKNKADFRVILIGPKALEKAVDDEMYFIENDASVDDLMKEVIKRVGSNYPYSANYVIEVGQHFNISKAVYDAENDLLHDYGFQYVQEDIFDNSMGLEDFSRAAYDSSLNSYSDHQANSFSKVGLFKIYAYLKDKTGQALFDKFSNLSEVSVLVHRKPIADYSLDWTYDTNESKYKTIFVDKSYDLDHEYSHPTKGIADIKGMYRLTSESSWIYSVPDELSAGTYEFRYVVKDLEGSWSDPKVTVFTLSDVPPPQLLDGKLRTVKGEFSLSSIPGTEWLEFYDVRTRYPLDHKLRYRWLKSGSALTNYVTMDSDYLSSNQDRFYEPFKLEVPKKLSDGQYSLELCVFDKNNDTIQSSKLFDVTVHTPVNLETVTPNQIIPGSNRFEATTSKYVDQVVLTLYSGTSYEEIFMMTKQNDRWIYDYISEASVPDGIYSVSYEGIINSEPFKQEMKTDEVEKISLKAESIIIQGDWEYWDGGNNIFGEPLSEEPHRFMSLEAIDIIVKTIGQPDSIEVTMSPELMAMTYVDELNNTYYYSELVGNEVSFPLYMSSQDKDKWHVAYVLPLADTTKTLDGVVIRPPYEIKIVLVKGDARIEYVVDDIHITGNTLDRLYIQPNE